MSSQPRVKPPLSHPCYLALRVNLRVFREFASLLRQSGSKPVILDIGCGEKPFRSLLNDVRHIGSDISAQTAADVLADNAMLPFRAASFDAVLASETLEHTRDYEHAIDEMIRVCKPEGLLFVSVPFLYPIHQAPYDFQRLTSIRLNDLFREHEVILFASSNSIFSGWLMTLGYALAYGTSFLPFPAALTFIPQVLINVFAVSIDGIALGLRKSLQALGLRKRVPRKEPDESWTAMPAGYALLVRVKKGGLAAPSVVRASPAPNVTSTSAI
jgi:SAM-dependent methyltransferase